jgi:hypothetical protein
VFGTLGLTWQKRDVLPMVIVKPGIVGFEPAGSDAMLAIGNTWTKKEVVPVCIVEPSLGGFAPVRGSPIGNTWRKSEVKPIVLVVPALGGGFTPPDP